MPYKREYNEPALLYPIYNHCFSLTELEFASVAYAFLNSLSRLGASNPKGVRIAEGPLVTESEPLIVVDRYLTPLGKRPVLSPQETNPNSALHQFRESAFFVFGQHREQATIEQDQVFTRWIGEEAIRQLQQYSLEFTQRVLLGRVEV